LKRRVLWTEQQEEDRLQAEADRVARQAQEEENRQLAAEAERLRNEEDARQANLIAPISGNKKIKFIPYTEPAPRDSITPCPSPYAISKLEAFEFIDLYYFTTEGLAEAAASLRSTADDIFGIEKINSTLALRSIPSSTASRNLIKDEDLTWSQMTMAKNGLLQYAQNADWPKPYLQSLAAFFFKLESHEYRKHTRGEKTLILYQARVRFDWHEAFKHNRFFHIGNINESLLREIADEVLHLTQENRIERMNEVLKTFNAISTDTRSRSARSNRRSSSPSRPTHHRHSRSRSPHRNPPSSSSQDRTGRNHSNSYRQSFRTPDTRSTSLVACAICLGRHRHVIGKCNNATLWSGQPSACLPPQ
jgi:hypothetical protein